MTTQTRLAELNNIETMQICIIKMAIISLMKRSNMVTTTEMVVSIVCKLLVVIKLIREFLNVVTM